MVYKTKIQKEELKPMQKGRVGQFFQILPYSEIRKKGLKQK